MTLFIILLTVSILLVIYFFAKEEKKASKSVENENQKNNKQPEQTLQITDEFNDILNILENTNDSIFITGKAGTGKSSLLKHFIKNTKKNTLL